MFITSRMRRMFARLKYDSWGFPLNKVSVEETAGITRGRVYKPGRSSSEHITSE